MKSSVSRRLHQHLRAVSSSAVLETMTSTWIESIDESIKKSRSIRGGNYVQIATVDEAGRPHCRTVVFRGFLDLPGGNQGMKMITDARSEKVEQILHSPTCELVWWFAKTSEQYRIAGTLQLISQSSENLQEERLKQWKNLSDPAREQFYWANPGLYDPEALTAQPDGGRDSEGTILPPPDTFLLMILIPEQVRYLRLRDNYAQLDSHSPEGWTSTRVNP